jgi:hypothetical protein
MSKGISLFEHICALYLHLFQVFALINISVNIDGPMVIQKEVGRSWNKLRFLVADRQKWKELIANLCS